MSSRKEIVSFLDEYLATTEVPDPYSTNGLQVEGAEQIERIGFCVDACMQTFEQLEDCHMVVVHHGLFWPSIKRVTGPMRRSLAYLLTRDISLYCSHLPLDLHAEVGNNACLIDSLGWTRTERFDQVGWLAEGPARPLAEFEAWGRATLGDIRLLHFGGDTVARVAVSSGGGSIGMVYNAVSAGADLFITGEASHPIYHAAKEVGLNVLLGGHYATETWGVRALMPVLAERFGVKTRFVDVPTGF